MTVKADVIIDKKTLVQEIQTKGDYLFPNQVDISND